MTDFLGIKDNLLELACLSEALDNLVGYIGSEIHRKCESWINTLHKISKLLAALQLKCKGPYNVKASLRENTVLESQNHKHEGKLHFLTN